MLLQVKNVEKSFAGNQVLKDVNLSVNKGDVVVILGPSGSGKTTFLRCLNFWSRLMGADGIWQYSVGFCQGCQKSD